MKFYLKFVTFIFFFAYFSEVSTTNIKESIFDLSVEWQRHLRRNNEIGANENFLSSPLGISVLLAEIRIFANLQLKEAINQLLNWGKGNRVHLEFQRELDKLDVRQDEVFTLKCQNAIFLPKEVNVSEIAEDLLKDHYKSDIVKLDWRNRSLAQQTVDSWVSQSTNKLIQQLPLPQNAEMLLANTIYFEAEWLDPLDARMSANLPFKVSPNKTVNVDYMRFSEDLFFAEDTYYLKCKVIAKPYKTHKTSDESRIKMYFILPDEDNDIENLISLISNLNFNQMLQFGDYKKVTYQLPKVSVKSKFKFKPFLSEFYGKELNYEVQGLTLGDKRLNIDDISQETVLEVDEKGTRAASVSSATIDYNSADKTFKVDRPYIMLLRDEDTKFVLFWATIRDPTSN